ncbi:hypothetical protein ACOKFD_01495 [Flagellimonas sp. S174]|uniref:hypothetical protein n=1 Tax=Flagellimonas sp. S174 TaxID=3410790 RepID=UPI003BF4FBD1
MLSVLSLYTSITVALFQAKKKYSFSIYFAFLALFIYISLNFLISGGDITNMTDLMHTKGVGTWFCLGLIFTSYNDKRYLYFKKFLYFSALYICILTLYNFVDFGIGAWRMLSISKYRIYTVNLIWIVPFLFLQSAKIKRQRSLAIFFMAITALASLIIQTRSFLLILSIVILFDFFHTKKKHIYLIFFGFLIAIMIYLAISTDIFSSSLESLDRRSGDDTRTEQLKVFWEQLQFFEVVTGKGFRSEYLLGGSYIGHVDNQWLYLIWWGGLIPFLCYAYLTLVIPVKVLLSGKIEYNTKVECFILILWTLALSGLAIFTSMSIDFYFFTITIILGRVLYKFSNLKKAKKHEPYY